MVLAEPVKDPYLCTIHPSGLQLSDENLHQLASHHADFICVSVPDMRSDAQVASETAAAARRVMDIFEHADLTDPVTAALLKQVLAYRSEQC